MLRFLPRRPGILVTNDDGIGAPGILAVVRALVRSDRYAVRVVAPMEENSGVSSQITLHKDLRVRRCSLPDDLASVPAYGVYGTPADCVAWGLQAFGTDPTFSPRLVVSGINYGANFGRNILYSGTVAGATEAVINGLSAISLSLDAPATDYFDDAASQAIGFVDAVLAHSDDAPVHLNINVPHRPISQVKGWVMSTPGTTVYRRAFKAVEHEQDGTVRFVISGSHVSDPGAVPGPVPTDVDACRDGYISVSALDLGRNAPKDRQTRVETHLRASL